MTNQKGSILIFVLMMLLVLSILAMAIMSLTITNIKITSAEKDFQSVYYIAEAGAYHELQFLRSNVMTVYRDTSNAHEFYQEFDKYLPGREKDTNTPPIFESYFGKTPVLKVTCTTGVSIDNVKSYTLISKGSYGDITRTVLAPFELKYVPKGYEVFDNVIFSMGDITIKGNEYGIKSGCIGANGKINADHIDLSPRRNAQEGMNREYILPEFPKDLPATHSEITDPLKIKDNQHVTIDHEVFFNSVEICGSLEFLLSEDGHDMEVYIRNFKLAGGTISIAGSGRLLLYVDNFEGSGNFNYSASPVSLIIIVKAGGVFSLSDTPNFIGAVYAPQSEINLNGNLNFTGAIIGGEVNIVGNTLLEYKEIDSEAVPIYDAVSTLEKLYNPKPVREQ
jgi:hypothetical protein